MTRSLLVITSFSLCCHVALTSPTLQLPQNAVSILNTEKIQYKIKPRYQKKLAKNYLRHYYEPWRTKETGLAGKREKQDLQDTINYFKDHQSWDENKAPHTQNWAPRIEANMNLAHYPNRHLRAISINATDLRVLPTHIPAFGDEKRVGQGYPFDNLQVARVPANQPILILQTTKDGAWDFVDTSNDVTGWVAAKDIATVSPKFIREWQRHKYYVTPIIPHFGIKAKSGQYYFKTRIGSLYPLIKKHRHNYTIRVATRDAFGHGVIQYVNIPKQIVRPWPLVGSSQNIAQVANIFLGSPYGWGGLYGYRDCSATLRDLYAPFGIWLPRNSAAQAKAGVRLDLRNLSQDEKAQKIIKDGIPFYTLLWLPGHIVLFIGRDNNQVIVFHSPWGLHTRDAKTEKTGRLVIGKAVITRANLGQQLNNVPLTWLDLTQSMTYLVPMHELIAQKT